jgi:hypothetical protein
MIGVKPRWLAGVLVAHALALLACKGSPTGAQTYVGPPRPATAAHAQSPCEVLAGRLCDRYGRASEVCTMATEQTRAFASNRCAAMLARYEQTAVASVSFAHARVALMAREQRTLHGPAPMIGPADAKITMVMFSDFDDPECGRAAPLAHAIENLYGDRVRLIFRQLPSALRPHAHLAAEASLAAHAQGKFWPFHDLLFGNPQARDREALVRYAKETGLDVRRLERDLDRRAFAADVDADVDLGRQLRIDATPALFVDGNQVPFPFGVAELEQILGSADTASP